MKCRCARSLAGFKSKRVVAIEQKRNAASPFEYFRRVFLLIISLYLSVRRGMRRTKTTGENEAPSSLTLSLSPFSMFFFWEFAGLIDRMKPWVQLGMLSKSSNYNDCQLQSLFWSKPMNKSYHFADMLWRAINLNRWSDNRHLVVCTWLCRSIERIVCDLELSEQ